jgi:hypothetical protein
MIKPEAQLGALFLFLIAITLAKVEANRTKEKKLQQDPTPGRI